MSEKTRRIFIALFTFMGTICTLLYIGFALKVDLPRTNPTAATTANKPVFYQSIGGLSRPAKSGTTTTTNLGERYAVEIKVVSEQSEAERMLTDLAKQGIQAYYTPFNSRGRVYFRIRTGAYPDRQAAEDSAQKMKISQKLPATIVKLQ
jgi:cell division septation protein DedD